MKQKKRIKDETQHTLRGVFEARVKGTTLGRTRCFLSEPEIRHDAVFDRWVIVSPNRSKRPKKRAGGDACPFCPGNEKMTPPAWLVYSRRDGSLVRLAEDVDYRVEDWLIRCFQNMYPALKDDVPFMEKDGSSLFLSATAYSGFGYHEVIVESRDHYAHPPACSLKQLELLVEAYFDVMSSLSYQKRVKYVCIFRNYRPEAGASIPHPHSQAIALPVVPTTVRREIQASRRYNRRSGGCVYCDMIESEASSPRLIYSDDHYVALTPWVSLSPYEFWIVPRRHEPSFTDTHPKERRALARAFKATLSALKRALRDPPYNYGFHVSPPRSGVESYHWHIEVHPRLTVPAGFELATGMYINSVPPERAAEALRSGLRL